MNAKVMIASLMLFLMGSVFTPTTVDARDDLCEDNLAECTDDCNENWGGGIFQGACYTGCGAGYAACEVAIEEDTD